MPGLNGTGPQGCGPRTGRGTGTCETGATVEDVSVGRQAVTDTRNYCRCGQFLRRGFRGGRGGNGFGNRGGRGGNGFGNRGNWQ